MKILVLNAGSSSQKSCLYKLAELPDLPPEPLWEAKIDWSKKAGIAVLKVVANSSVLEEELEVTRTQSITRMLDTLCSGKTQVITQLSEIDGVGHRVVHGGREYCESTLITPEVKAAIADLAILAPAHNPASLEGITAIEQVLSVPQVAVFDTAFHRNLPQAAAVYPIPYEWYEQGIQRYGFHGISHQYCAQRTAQILGQDLASLRLIICHLGNGCSLAAIRYGESIDTTMGFTPLEGLMMGSRSGSIDPSILIHLLRQGNYTVDQLDEILNHGSGLQGVSGLSSDLRQIVRAIEEGHSRAKLAFEVYVHRLRSQIGAMLATLGGLDALVFTAGVGENQPDVRAAACENFGFLGLKLDPAKNAQSPADQDIAAVNSTVRVVLVHTQEDWAIAQACWQHFMQAPG